MAGTALGRVVTAREVMDLLGPRVHVRIGELLLETGDLGLGQLVLPLEPVDAIAQLAARGPGAGTVAPALSARIDGAPRVAPSGH